MYFSPWSFQKDLLPFCFFLLRLLPARCPVQPSPSGRAPCNCGQGHQRKCWVSPLPRATGGTGRLVFPRWLRPWSATIARPYPRSADRQNRICWPFPLEWQGVAFTDGPGENFIGARTRMQKAASSLHVNRLERDLVRSPKGHHRPSGGGWVSVSLLQLQHVQALQGAARESQPDRSRERPAP